jgi:hypothetical protein
MNFNTRKFDKFGTEFIHPTQISKIKNRILSTTLEGQRSSKIYSCHILLQDGQESPSVPLTWVMSDD